MIVNVEYVTSAAVVTKRRNEQIEIEERANIGDLLEKLIGMYGVQLEKVISVAGNLDGVFVFVSKKSSDFQSMCGAGRESELEDGDRVIIGELLVGG